MMIKGTDDEMKRDATKRDTFTRFLERETVFRTRDAHLCSTFHAED